MTGKRTHSCPAVCSLSPAPLRACSLCCSWQGAHLRHGQRANINHLAHQSCNSPDLYACAVFVAALALSVGTRNRRQGCSIALRGAQEGCARTTRAPPDRAAQARARPRPRCRLDHSRHRLGRVLLTITLAPQASAAAAPQGSSRRRLPPTLAPMASCAAGSRGCSRPTAALAVGLRRGGRPPGLASRSRAASFRGRCCPGLLAPQTPAASRFLRQTFSITE